MKIKVTRAFMAAGGAVRPVGSVMEVDARLGSELIACGKAELAADSPPAPAAFPMTTESVPALVKRKAKE